jgi:hypothetical protein
VGALALLLCRYGRAMREGAEGGSALYATTLCKKESSSFSDAFSAVIDRENLLPPVQTIQILSQKKTVPLRLVREFIISRLEQIDKTSAENTKAINSYAEASFPSSVAMLSVSFLLSLHLIDALLCRRRRRCVPKLRSCEQQ